MAAPTGATEHSPATRRTLRSMTDLPGGQPLFLTHAKGKVHIKACPHLADSSELIPATAQHAEQNGYCSHCEKEIAGIGRRYFDTLDDAFEAFGHRSDEAKRLIREAVAGVEYDAIWIPASESYIALASGNRASAWIGKGYVDCQGRQLVELPWFEPHGGGGRSQPHTPGELCEIHFIEKSTTGVCEYCE